MAHTLEISTPPIDLRVLVVAGDLLARAGLASLLDDEPGVKVVGQTAGERLEDELDVYRPDIVVWDAGVDGGAISLPENLSEDIPAIALVADQATASAARRQGMDGVLPRDAPPQLIVSAMAAVMQGLIVLDPSFAGALPSAGATSDSSGAIDVTPRELEVLRHLAQGTSNKAIAYELDISEHTVKFHVNSIMTKLDARSRTEAVVIATRLGLIPL